jgi:hypothetical protein
VFFYLLRRRAEKSDRLAIFYPDYQQSVPLTDDELRARLADALEWPRATAQQARLRLAGRPSKIPPPDLAPDTPYVIFNLESGAAQAPPLSSDLPPVGVATTCRVLASTAQWRKIAPALVQRPDARIGVVGTVDAGIDRRRCNHADQCAPLRVDSRDGISRHGTNRGTDELRARGASAASRTGCAQRLCSLELAGTVPDARRLWVSDRAVFHLRRAACDDSSRITTGNEHR